MGNSSHDTSELDVAHKSVHMAVLRTLATQATCRRHLAIVDAIWQVLIDVVVVKVAGPSHDYAEIPVKNVGAPERSFAAL